MTAPERLFLCSRCKLGKNRVFYVVWKWGDWLKRREPLVSGYTTTTAEAEAILATATGEQTWNAGYAQSYHRRLAEEKRRQRPASTELGSTAIEFVYRDFWSNEYLERHAIPHRIIRRTRQRVFVNIRPYCHDGENFGNRRTYALNRAQLEQTGSASTGSGWGIHRFYVSIEAFNRDHGQSFGANPPACLAFFGLKLPTNLDSLKAVYRDRVKETHPDHGGSPEDFRQVQQQYETALTFLEHQQESTR